MTDIKKWMKVLNESSMHGHVMVSEKTCPLCHKMKDMCECWNEPSMMDESVCPMCEQPKDMCECSGSLGIMDEGSCPTCNEKPCVCDEGNAFSGKLAAARAHHKDSFNVDGHQYPVKEEEDGPGDTDHFKHGYDAGMTALDDPMGIMPHNPHLQTDHAAADKWNKGFNSAMHGSQETDEGSIGAGLGGMVGGTAGEIGGAALGGIVGGPVGAAIGAAAGDVIGTGMGAKAGDKLTGESVCSTCNEKPCICDEGAGVMHFKDQKAKAAGKSSFKLGGKTFPVKESADEEVLEDWNVLYDSTHAKNVRARIKMKNTMDEAAVKEWFSKTFQPMKVYELYKGTGKAEMDEDMIAGQPVAQPQTPAGTAQQGPQGPSGPAKQGPQGPSGPQKTVAITPGSKVTDPSGKTTVVSERDKQGGESSKAITDALDDIHKELVRTDGGKDSYYDVRAQLDVIRSVANARGMDVHTLKDAWLDNPNGIQVGLSALKMADLSPNDQIPMPPPAMPPLNPNSMTAPPAAPVPPVPTGAQMPMSERKVNELKSSTYFSAADKRKNQASAAWAASKSGDRKDLSSAYVDLANKGRKLSAKGDDQAAKEFKSSLSAATKRKLSLEESHAVHLEVEDHHEVRMAQADLYKMAKCSTELHAILENVSELEGWVQAKITLAADYIETVKDHLEYEMARKHNEMHADSELTLAESKKKAKKSKK